MNKNGQNGMTLIELMISITLGLVVTGAVSVFYLTSAQSSYTALKSSKLNQEMMTLMSIMAQDIRRAGFDSNVSADPTISDFNVPGTTGLAVFTFTPANSSVAPNPAETGSGNCIVYSYDSDLNGTVGTWELYGFRLNNGAVQMRQDSSVANASTCVNDSNTNGEADWVTMTDDDLINVSALTFDLSESECLNTDEDDSAAAVDCYAVDPDSGETIVESRTVNITVVGNLIDDPAVAMTLSQSVRVRNDIVRVVP